MAVTLNASTSSGLVQTADTSGVLQLQTASTTAVTVDASQNVGIGTSSPSTKLQTSSSGNNWITIASTGTTGQEVGTIFNAPTSSGASNQWKIGTNSTIDNEFTLYDITSSQIVNRYIRGASGYSSFWTNGTERMRITSGGCLTIGATAPVVGTEIFSVNPTAAGWGFSIYASGSASNGMYVKYSTTPNNNGSEFFYYTDATAVRAYMKSNGGLGNYSANNTNLSDERLKTDIVPATTYLDKICSIPVVTFKYKDQTDNELNLGVIAQEVDKVAPELVDHSGFGETPEGESPYLAIYQTDLQYALMKCIQEQQTIINDLKARVTALEAK